MTVEQALVYLLAAVAGVCLFLGLAEALDDRPPRRRHGRAAAAVNVAGTRPEFPARIASRNGATMTQPARADAGVARPADANADSTPVTPASRRSDSVLARSRDRGSETEIHALPVLGVVGPSVHAKRPAVMATRPPIAGDDDVVFVERCMSLSLAGQHDKLIAATLRRLTDRAETPAVSSPAPAALWSLVGLARRARGEDADAQSALEEGVRALPPSGPGACPPRIAALVTTVARRFLVLTERGVDEPEGARIDQRVAAARLAGFWLGWRLAAVPEDRATETLLATAREALAEAHAEAATAMVARCDFAGARHFVERMVEAGELPRGKADVLLELVASAVRREVDRLTTPAVRGARDESGAVTGLGQAEALLASMPAETLSPSHRAAATSRIWRAHAKLGFRRLRLGQLDGAADTLCHALSMQDVGRRRQRQVRDALVRTLEGLGDQRAQAIDTLVGEGNQAGAEEQIASLDRRIAFARDHGLTDDDLEVACGKLRELRRLVSAAASP